MDNSSSLMPAEYVNQSYCLQFVFAKYIDDRSMVVTSRILRDAGLSAESSQNPRKTFMRQYSKSREAALPCAGRMPMCPWTSSTESPKMA